MILLILGVILFVAPIEVLSSWTVTQVGAVHTIEYHYTPMSTVLNTAISMVFVLGGMYGVYAGLRGRNDEEEVELFDEYPE